MIWKSGGKARAGGVPGIKAGRMGNIDRNNEACRSVAMPDWGVGLMTPKEKFVDLGRWCDDQDEGDTSIDGN